METIPISFKLLQFQPDQRQYKTSMPIFEPCDNLKVVINVPWKNKFILGIEEITQEDIKEQGIPDPLILTLAGWAYIEDAFLARTNKTEVEKQSNEEITWEEFPGEQEPTNNEFVDE